MKTTLHRKPRTELARLRQPRNGPLTKPGVKLTTRAALFVLLTTAAIWSATAQVSFTRILEGDIANDKGTSVGCAWGDYDNDGYPDLFVANAVASTNRLYHNNRNGSFSRLTTGKIFNERGDSDALVWGDYDNDGDLDLFAANYDPPRDFFYRNEGDGDFTKITQGAWVKDSGAGVGATWGDYDNDGFLDLFVANGLWSSSPLPPEAGLLYRNDGGTNHWLELRLVGTASNRSVIGAKIRLLAAVGGKTFWQLREISGGSGYCSQNDLRAHFGLGDATAVETIRIEWPSGIVQEFGNLAANQFLTVTEQQPGVTTAPHLALNRTGGRGPVDAEPSAAGPD
jgi:hypothetical protein